MLLEDNNNRLKCICRSCALILMQVYLCSCGSSAANADVSEITAEETTAPEQALSALAGHDDCADAYRKLLRQLWSDLPYMSGYYLTDLNGSGCPELLVYEGDAHASKVRIYTWCAGEIIELGSFGEFGEVYIDTEHHSIDDRFFSMGGLKETWYDVNERDVTGRGYAAYGERFDEEKQEPYYVYFVDDRENVTKEEYDRAVSAYSTGNYKKFSVSGCRMTGLEDRPADITAK